MKKLDLTTLTLLALTVIAHSPLPSAWAGVVAEREENQQERIAEGLKTGQLTAQEAAHLEKGEAKLEAERREALSDGKMTGHEKKKLIHHQNKLSHKIHHLKHNSKKA